MRQLLIASAALWSAAVFAGPDLAGVSPADQSEGVSPERITLRFTDRLVARRSAAKLTMTAMPGMADHPPMGMAVTVSAGKDPHTMLLTPDQPLPRGSYRVDWRAVSGDTPASTGSTRFTVR